MRGPPFTPCRMRVDWGEVPAAGAFLTTAAGSAYRVERAQGRTIHCTRWSADQIPADAEVIEWAWARRERRAARSSA